MATTRESSTGAPDDSALRADCGNCFALCCVALPFTASADFAISKDAGQPCPNLLADFGCGIHARLRGEGFGGCAVFDCFGAGQQVSQVTFAGHDWRRDPHTARSVFDAFAVMRQLHELLWYLTDALRRPAARPVHDELRTAVHRTDELTRAGPEELTELDVSAYRAEVNTLLLRTSEHVRATVPGPTREHRNADLIGATLRRVDLRGADLRGAYLIAADVTDTDLTAADLIGADLRDAKLHGCDLSASLFLTQAQVNAAAGDAATALPDRLQRPDHW